MEKDPISEELGRRFRNPFYGSWGIAFVAWNWKAILLFLYPMSMDFFDRLNWLAANVYDNVLKQAIYLYVGPMATGALAASLLPSFANWLDAFRYRSQVKYKNKREQIDEQLTKNQLEIAKLKGALAEAHKENENKNLQIDKINKQRAAEDQESKAEIARQHVRAEKNYQELRSQLISLVGYDPDVLKALKSIHDGMPIADGIRVKLRALGFISDVGITPMGREALNMFPQEPPVR